MPRAARDSDACLWHVSIVGGSRRRGCAAGGVSVFLDGPLRERRSEKWSAYPPDVLPAWVAEMDFDLAPPIREALHRAIDLGDLGYIGNVDGLLRELAGFMARRLNWEIDIERVALVSDVMVGFKE